MDNNYISIAKILNFHGIKGEAKIGFTKGREEQVEKLTYVFIKIDDDFVKLDVSSVRFHKHFAIIKFKQFNSINDVEKYKGYDLFLEKENIENSLKDDEYLISDLIGLNVYDKDDCLIGVISAIGENGVQNIISVCDANNNEHLIPFVKELVPYVDINGKKIVINDIEGLLN